KESFKRGANEGAGQSERGEITLSVREARLWGKLEELKDLPAQDSLAAFPAGLEAREMKAMLHGGKPHLLAGLVRFLMECDEALAMRGDDYLNPLYAHTPVSPIPRSGSQSSGADTSPSRGPSPSSVPSWSPGGKPLTWAGPVSTAASADARPPVAVSGSTVLGGEGRRRRPWNHTVPTSSSASSSLSSGSASVPGRAPSPGSTLAAGVGEAGPDAAIGAAAEKGGAAVDGGVAGKGKRKQAALRLTSTSGGSPPKHPQQQQQ
ncbi:unnamed protein product, partial [Scytosiphon promiscuus]